MTDVQDYDLQLQAPLIVLSNGEKLPVFGLGTWKLEEEEVVKNCVKSGVRAGYRYIDCAAAYGNEKYIGEAVQEILQEGVIERQDLFILSKLRNSDHNNVEQACRKTLQDLQLEYLDAYLIHFPVPYGKFDPPASAEEAEKLPKIEDVWKEMEKLLEKGLTKCIGVSNFSIGFLQRIFKVAKVLPQICQIECHPYLRNEKLIDFCKSHGIHVTAYSPIGSPDSVEIFQRQNQPVLMEDETVKKIAHKNDLSPPEALICWGLQHGTSVIVKSAQPKRVKQNLQLVTKKLPREDFEELSNLPIQHRMIHGKMFLSEFGPCQTLAQLWGSGEEATGE